MQTRPLGNTGLHLPILSFGASSLGAEFRSVKLDEALASVRVALEAVRHAAARKIVLAVPVAASKSAAGLMADCDEAVFLATPKDFQAVGQYYADFHQLEDWEIHRLLHPPAPDGMVH